MNAITQRSAWLITAPVALLVVGYVAFFFWPARKELARLREQLATTRSSISDASLLAVKLPIVQDELKETTEHTAAWMENIPEADGVVEVFGKISELAKTAGTTPSRFAPSPAIEDRFLRRVPLALTCTGEFGEIRQFLQDLEALPQLIWVDEVHIEPFQQNSELARCELKITLFGRQSENSD